MSAPPSSPSPEGQDSRSRLDREIDEILARNDNIRLLPPPPEPAKPARPTIQIPTLPWAVRRFFEAPIILAVAIAIVAYLLRDLSPLLANIGATVAVACIIWPVAQSFRRPRTSVTTRTWRGQVYQAAPPASASIIDSVRRWWNDRRR